MADAVVVDPAILSNIQFLPSAASQTAAESKDDKTKISKTWKPERTISAVCSGGNFEFSADGEIAYSLHDGKVNLWKTCNMNVEKSIEFDNEDIITFTVHKKVMVTTGKNGGLRLWDLETATCVKYMGTGSSIVLDMRFDPSGRYLACGTADRRVKVFDMMKDKITHDFLGHKLSVSLVRWLPSKSNDKNKFIIYSASEEGVIKIWDLVLNSCLGTLHYHRSQIPSLVFTNDLKTLIVSSRDQKLSFWDLKDNTFSRIGALQLNEDVEGMQYVNLQISKTKAAPYLITGGTDGKLKILDINNQKYVYEEEDPLKQEIEKVFYLPKDNQILVLTNDQVLTYYHLFINESTEKPQLKRQYSLCLYNDEIIDLKFLKWLDDHIVMWSNSELAKVVDMKSQKSKLLTGHEDIIIAVDTFGDYFITGSKDMTWRIWKLIHFSETESSFVCLAILKGHNMSITSLCIEPKRGNYFVSSGQDNTIKKWNISEILSKDYLKNPSEFPVVINTAQASEVAHLKYINVVRISPGDKNKLVATASHDRTIKIWSAGNFELKATLKGHKRGVWDVEFSPLERILASASSDKTIKLWNVINGQWLNTLEGHLNSTVKVLWVNNGLQIFSAGSDGSWKIWNVKKSTCINTFEEHDDKIWAMDALNDRILTGGSDSKLIEWRDVTQEVEEEEYKVKAEKSQEEHLLSSMIYEGRYKEAAIQAFKLKKNRDLFSVIEMILDQTKEHNIDSDPVLVVLNNAKRFSSQFQGSEIQDAKPHEHLLADLAIKEIVQEMIKIDSVRLLEIIRDLNVHQKYCKIAQILLFQIFKIFGLSKFIDFIEKQFKAKNAESKLKDPKNFIPISRKDIISKIKNYLTIIDFYSKKHVDRVQRNQKLGYLVSFVLSKFTLEQEKSDLKSQFDQNNYKNKYPKKKRELKAERLNIEAQG